VGIGTGLGVAEGGSVGATEANLGEHAASSAAPSDNSTSRRLAFTS
jgi:hypothetical protein